MKRPAHTNVLIIGGGIAGCSIAYHLTKLGIRDVVLCERRQLTCGTNWEQVEKPFEIEVLVSKVVKEHRVSGNTSGDSIEWYHLSSEELWSVVLQTLSKRTHSDTN